MNRIRTKIIYRVLEILYAHKREESAEKAVDIVKAYMDGLKDAEQIPRTFQWYDVQDAMQEDFDAGNIEQAIEAAHGVFDDLPDSWK